MRKVTNSQEFTEKPKSGVSVKIQPHKKKRGMNFYMPSKVEGEKGNLIEVNEFNQKFILLGSINRYEGSKIGSALRVYSTYFEYNKDHCQLWEKDKGEGPRKIYEGFAGDADLKEKSSFRGGKYTVHVFAINEKGFLSEIILNGKNVGPWFDFVKENKNIDAFQILPQLEIENPQKNEESLFLMDFKLIPEAEVKIPESIDCDAIIDQLQIYINHCLNFAKTGSHESRSSETEINTTVKQEVNSVNPLQVTNDDDLPF